jgi:hypothetical protein
MTLTSIVVEVSSVRVRPGGPATANIWLIIDGYEFPTQRWNDFVVVVLGWWVAAFLVLLRNTSTRETMHFMDGPYAVEVSKTPSGILKFRALEGAGRTREMATGEGPLMPVVLGLISQAHEILEECKRQGWWSRDAEALESSLAALEQEFGRLLR